MRELIKPPVQGAPIVVQVERGGRGGKGPRVSARPTFTGARLVYSPLRPGLTISDRIVDAEEAQRLAGLVKAIAEPGEGWIVRTAAEDADLGLLREEARRLRSAWHVIREGRHANETPVCVYREPPVDCRLLRDHGAMFAEVIFDSRGAADAARAWCESMRLEVGSRIVMQRQDDWVPSPIELREQVEAALDPHVQLPSGGSVLFEPTATLTAVDVDSGGATGFPGDLGAEQVFLRTNMEAAQVIADQLRLRNIGGIVVVDFIDLKDRTARRRVVDRLRAAVASDPAPCWIGAMSRLGLVEMTRRRRGRTLAALLTEPCDRCEATGRLRRVADEGEG